MSTNRHKSRFTYLLIVITFIFVSFATPLSAGGPKTHKGYTCDLKELVEEAKQKIAKIDGELKQKEVKEEGREREAEANKYFEDGLKLCKEGKLSAAKDSYRKALNTTRDPMLTESIKKAKRDINDKEPIPKKKQQSSNILPKKELRK